jgi:hypothetical protein
VLPADVGVSEGIKLALKKLSEGPRMSIQTDDFSPAASAAPGAAGLPRREEALERALRPKQLDDYVGQAKAREQLEIFIGAARKRRRRWTMCCCSARRAWARPRWPTSSRPSWA